MKTLYALAHSLNGNKVVTLAVAAGIYLWSVTSSEFPPGVLQGLLVLLMTDWLMGTARAWTEKKLSAQVAWAGVVKLVVYLFMVALVNYLARIDIGKVWGALTDTLLAVVSAAMMLTEAISILQHLRFYSERYGVQIPILVWLIGRLETEEKKLKETS